MFYKIIRKSKLAIIIATSLIIFIILTVKFFTINYSNGKIVNQKENNHLNSQFKIDDKDDHLVWFMQVK
jgi:hypothetical protein